VNPLMVACVHASLSVFQRAGGVEATRQKSLLLTGYLEALLRERGLTAAPAAECEAPTAKKAKTAEQTSCHLQLITPSDPTRRGCQLSLRVLPPPKGKKAITMRQLEAVLMKRGVVTDAREPDVVRVAPAPLYNSFSDVYRCVTILGEVLSSLFAD